MGNRGLIIRPEQFTLNTLNTLAQNLVLAGLGRFPGSTHYQDSSLYGNHGSITGAPTLPGNWRFIADLNRWAYYTTRDNDSIVVPYNPSFYDANAMALSFWIKVDDLNFSAGVGYVLGQWDWAATKRMWSFSITAANPGIYQIAASSDGSGNTGKLLFKSFAASPSTTWTHIALNIRDRRYYNLYINGQFSEQMDMGATYPFENKGSALHTALLGGLANRGPKADMADILWRVGRFFTPTEIQLLADPSNVMLSGLIQAPKRRMWVVPSSGAGTFPAAGDGYVWAVPEGVVTSKRVTAGDAFAWAVGSGATTSKRVTTGEGFAWAVGAGELLGQIAAAGQAYAWAVGSGAVTAKRLTAAEGFAWAVGNGAITAKRLVSGDGYAWFVGSGSVLEPIVASGDGYVWSVGSGAVTAKRVATGEGFVWSVGSGSLAALRTYITYDNNALEIWVEGKKVASFKADGDVDVYGVVNESTG